MARPITVTQPIIFPACCINCGAVENSGRWFVDLGFDIDERFDAMPDGVVYLCEICVKDFIHRFMKIVEQQEMGLNYVRFGDNRTDPIFNEYREVLNRGEPTADSGESGVSTTKVSTSSLSATFGG